MSDANRKSCLDAAESKTCACVETLCTEIGGTPGDSLTARRGTVREGVLPHVGHAHLQESDGLVIPKKRANKAGPKAAAESVEEREPTKGNEMQVLLAADTAPRKAWHRHAWRTSGLRPARNTRGKSRMR